MRRISVMTAAVFLVMSAPSVAQEWIQYASRTDSFGVNFPSEPKVQDITYPTEYGITLPGHVYKVENGPSRYSITVVDYADAEAIHTARAAQCKKNGGEGDACQNDWRGDVQGSIVYASWKLMQRNAKVTHYARSVVDQVEGHQVQLLNPDGSRTFAAIHLHDFAAREVGFELGHRQFRLGLPQSRQCSLAKQRGRNFRQFRCRDQHHFQVRVFQRLLIGA